MTVVKWYIFGFVVIMLVVAIAVWLDAMTTKPPLENEEYLAEHPELRKLKQERQEHAELREEDDE